MCPRLTSARVSRRQEGRLQCHRGGRTERGSLETTIPHATNPSQSFAGQMAARSARPSQESLPSSAPNDTAPTTLTVVNATPAMRRRPEDSRACRRSASG